MHLTFFIASKQASILHLSSDLKLFGM